MPLDILKLLYPELDEVQRAMRKYCFACVAHRLRKFGFERGINHYQPRDLMALSLFMSGHQRDVLAQDAVQRGFDMEALQDAIQKTTPVTGKKD